jgi:hypothetical protein
MKIITSALALFLVSTVPVWAQTSSTDKTVLQIRKLYWYVYGQSGPCEDCSGLPEIAQRSRMKQGVKPDNLMAWVEFKNVSARTIKSIALDFVFRDLVTEQEFLTYNFRFQVTESLWDQVCVARRYC